MNPLLPLKGNVGGKRAFLEKEEDSIWEVNGLILLEAVPRVISAEWGVDQTIPALHRT